MLGLSVGAACNRGGGKNNGGTASPTDAPTVERIIEQPHQFIGKRVTLTGEVDTVHGPQAFELEGEGLIFDEEILVLTRSPVRLAGDMLEDEDDVIVTGTVRMLVVADIERELGWDLDPALETQWQNKPVLVAEAISKVSEYARWSEGEEQEGTRLGVLSMHMAATPEALAGQRIVLERVPVRSRAGKGLWIGDNQHTQVFVVPGDDAELPRIAAGERVDVRGTLRPTPPAKEATTRWNLDQAHATRMSQEPLYIEAAEISRAAPIPGRQEAARSVSYDEFRSDLAYHIGATVTGEATVVEVFSDRAFWLQSDSDKRVLAIVREDVPRPEMIDIKAGQRLRFTATAMSPADMDKVPGTLEADAKQAIQSQPAFLHIYWRDIEILEQPQQPGKSQKKHKPKSKK